MKKVNVVTYCTWKSYGSILQALSLQRVLWDFGYDSSLVLDEPQPKASLDRSFPSRGGLARRLADFHKYLNHKKLDKKFRETTAFIENNIPSIVYGGSYEEIQQNIPYADVWISGSDQVWNPNTMNPLFFLKFLPERICKISYAASMGTTRIPAGCQEEFFRNISGFDYLSVREEDNRMLIVQKTDKTIHRNIDPVFLLNKEQWREYARPYPGMNKPYVLVFPIYWDRQWNNCLKKLHREKDLEIVVVTSSPRRVYADRVIYDADPGQFLWLIDHAQFVVTSSFHGVAMSVIFEKRLFPVINPDAPSRISCLLDVLGIEKEGPEDLFSEKSPDYCQVKRKIREEQYRAQQYLNEALADL